MKLLVSREEKVCLYVANSSAQTVCYFLFRLFGARCDRAEPAAVFEVLLVLPSRSTFDAAFPALTEVLLCLSIAYPPLLRVG